jgi:hypothetical protein
MAILLPIPPLPPVTRPLRSNSFVVGITFPPDLSAIERLEVTHRGRPCHFFTAFTAGRKGLKFGPFSLGNYPFFPFHV